MKVCTKCAQVMSLDDFYEKKGTGDGRTSQCKPCLREGMWRARQKPEYRKKQAAASSAWQKNNGVRLNARRHGLTLEAYEVLLDAQGHCCAACKHPLGDETRDIHTDHDHACCPGEHSCGQCVRGILCKGCNIALGWLRSDKTRIATLWVYLLECERRTEDAA